ncbi:MAG: S8 family serine peptidase, partial [Planctomycetota bacterium]|nr:S8 family serine peptidase [Planctomycetota bacterium]
MLLSLSIAVPLLGLSFPDDGEATVPQERVFTPDQISVGPVQEDERSGETDAPWFEASKGLMANQGDGVPLPVPAIVEPGPGGDVVVSPATGNPFFLGFAAGPYFPPEGELVDPQLVQNLEGRVDGRPGEFTYASVMFSKRMTEARLDQLTAAGCRVLGFHPHYTVKVAIPAGAISEVSTLPFVQWVGVPQQWQKVSPWSPELTNEAGPGELMPFWVSVWESDLNAASIAPPIGRVDVLEPGRQYAGDDSQRPLLWQSNGWQHAALLAQGVQIEHYDHEINAFQVRITEDQISTLAALDFVLFVEPVLEPTLAAPVSAAPAPHDESTAMIMSDRVRSTYDGDTNQVAIVGIIDSGVENSHADLSIWGVGWSCSGDDPWNDDVGGGGNGHGTHCSGTILGRGVAESDHLGNAPGLASWGGTSRYFNFRGFSPGSCLNGNIQVATDIFDGSYNDGTNTTAKPMVVSNSWGYSLAGSPIGSEANCRTLDDTTYDDDQLYVFATGNEGSGAGTCRIEGSAKNVLSVGSIVDYISGTVGDPGNLWTSSSRGPCGDNRWKPNLTAPGRMIRSTLANNNTGYANYSGTSMATPHVAAAAATLCDHYSWTRYQPALLASMLMATAITDDDQSLSSPSNAHLDQYGAGRLNSYKSHYTTSDFAYIGNWNFDQTNANWFFSDFTVAAGTTRLVAVMRYVEEQCSAGASQALVNDYDLWLDQDPVDTGAGNTGDWFAQQSTVDNTEIRIIDNPLAGPWRWKTYPDSANGNVVKMAVTIYAILDDTTPDATLTLSVDDAFVKTNETVNATAEVDPT